MYLSGLNVHHQLHCLKMIRQAIYPEYYLKGKEAPRHMEDHIDHCVDSNDLLFFLLSIPPSVSFVIVSIIPWSVSILTGFRYPNGSHVQGRYLPRDV